MGGGYLLSINAAGAISITINGQNFLSPIFQTPGLPSSTIFDGQCHHIAVKRASNILSFFFDGNFVSSLTINSNLSMASNNYLRVGCDQLLSSTSAFKGDIDYLRIWNIAVRDHDILDNKQRCFNNQPGLVANWSFEQTPNEVILDATQYFHHGLIIPSHGTPVNTGPRFRNSPCASENCDYIVLEPASDPACNQNPSPLYCSQLNLICNADFEQENNLPGSFPNLAFNGCPLFGSSNEVVNWCTAGGTPSYFGRNTTFLNYSIPNNFITTNFSPFCVNGIDTWNGAANGNDHYAVLSYDVNNKDGIRTELTTPLLPNKNYTLRFRALCVNNVFSPAPVVPTLLKFELWDDNIGTNTIGIGSIPIQQGCGWNLYTMTFTTPATPINLDNFLVKVAGVQNGNSNYFFFVDDFEIFEISSDYPRWMSGTGSQRPSEIVTDATNNVYFAGFANQEITYPNNVVQGIPNEVTGFIASYDECGGVRWANNSNTSLVVYKSVTFNNAQNQLLVASETSTGINIEIYDPVNGNLISTTPVPNTTSDHVIITSKTDVNGQNWYILIHDNNLNQYHFVQYGIITTTISLSPSIPNTLQEISDFSINSFLTGNANRIFLTANINASSVIIDYTINTSNINFTYFITAINGNQSETLKLTSIEQNNAGILCVGGFYSNCDVSFNGITTIVLNVLPTAPGIHNNAFTFLFNPTGANVVANSGRYIGGNGASRTTKIIVNQAGDFIASGMMSSSSVTGGTNTNFNSTWIPNPNPGGLFYTKINGVTGGDQWIEQGITSYLGTWQRDLVCGTNGTIYGIGYLNGTIDFLQGDTWNSTTQCDNTYVLKIIDSGNNAVVDRHASPLLPSNHSSEKTKGYLLKNNIEFHELLRNNSIQDYYIIDFSGRIVNSDKTNITSNVWNQLAQGCYYLKENNSSSLKTIFICK